MSRYFIRLDENTTMYLDSCKVDIMNYDNNYGYEIFAIRDNDKDTQILFASEDDREYYIEEHGINTSASEIEFEYCTKTIFRQDGNRVRELCDGICDLNVVYKR